MTHLEMYLLLKLDTISDAATATAVLAVVSTPILFVAATLLLDQPEDSKKDVIRLFRLLCVPVVCVGIVALLVAIFLPTTKQAAAIWLVPKIANNDRLQDIADNTLDRIEELSREPLKGLLGEEGEEK